MLHAAGRGTPLGPRRQSSLLGAAGGGTILRQSMTQRKKSKWNLYNRTLLGCPRSAVTGATGRTHAARAHCIWLARKLTAPPPLELATQESPESPIITSTESSGSLLLPAGPVESSTASAVPPLVALPLSSFSSSSRSRLLQIASLAVLSASESDARLIRQYGPSPFPHCTSKSARSFPLSPECPLTCMKRKGLGRV